MHVLDLVRSSDKWQVTLPMYHRGHLALYPGTTVHLAPVVRREADPTTSALPERSSPSPFPEILGTTIHPKTWASVYRISLALYDAPGVLHHVLKSVARHGGSVLQLDSTSSDQELHHNVELMVDFTSLQDSTRDRADSSSQIEGLLLADCQQHIVAQQGEPFSLRAFPASGLRRMHSALSTVQVAGARDIVDTQQIGESGEIALAGVIRDVLAEKLDPRVDWKINPPFRYLVTSDTENRLFRVTFFPAAQSALWCAIRHLDKPGVIAAITDSLSSNGLTLLCALNRVQEHTGSNWFEVVLSKPGWRDMSTAALSLSPKEEIQRILTTEDLKKYDLKLFFNRSSARRATLEPAPEHAPLRIELLRRQVTVDEWLEEKEAELRRLTDGLVAQGRG